MNIDDYKDYESLKQEYYILLQEIETLNYDNFYLKESYDILFNDSNDAKWLERMKISDIEKYLRKKKMEKLSNEKKY